MIRFTAVRALSAALSLTALVGSSAPAAAQCEVDKFVGSNVNAQDQFGYSLALEGLTSIVGAFKGDPAGAESGAAYVFAYDGYQWIQEKLLAASDGMVFDHLGWDVALSPSETGAVVGAPDEDRTGLNNAGAAYVYFEGGSGWTQHVKLVASDAANNDRFGFSVATDGTFTAVGAPDKAGGGAVYVFKLFGAQWFQVQKLTAPDAHAGAQFGFDLAFDGITLAVGSRRFDQPGAAGAGQVYLYTLVGPSWTLQDSVESIDPKANDFFGTSLTVDGDRLVVGAPDDDDQGFGANSNTGVAFHFFRTGASWDFVEKVLPPQTSHGFSSSVALEGDTLLVGAYLDKQIGTDGGAAHVFELAAGSFDHQYKILLSDHVPLSEVGGQVALSGDLALISSEYDDDVAGNGGAAYGFSIAGKNCEPLYAWPESISLAAGGHQLWQIDGAGIAAGYIYWVLGSLTDAGGFQAGSVFIPLAIDPYFVITAQQKNGPNYPSSLGFLNASGDAVSAIVLPPGLDPGLAGIEVFHAFVVYHPVTILAVYASNVTKLTLLP